MSPSRGTLANIHIYLIFLETRIIGLYIMQFMPLIVRVYHLQFLPRDALVHSAVLRLHVVRLSVRLSVCL